MSGGFCPEVDPRGSEAVPTMKIQEAARANPKFFAAGGLRAGAAALPRVSLQRASDRPPRSGPIPRKHNSSLSRSQWLSSDRPFSALGGPDACAAAKVACRAHPEMLLAEDTKCAVRSGGCCAEVRQMQSTVGVRLEEIFQSPHHSCVPPVGTPNFDPVALAQALDHYPDQRLL